MLQQNTLDASSIQSAAEGRSCHLVIADGGVFARLLTIVQTRPLEIGHRFRFLDRQWKILAYRRHARAFVAQPTTD